MNSLIKWCVISAVLFMAAAGFYYSVFADHNDNDKGKKNGHYLSAVNNPTYKEQCGGCHFAYQPGLLPSGSWEKILAGGSNDPP